MDAYNQIIKLANARGEKAKVEVLQEMEQYGAAYTAVKMALSPRIRFFLTKIDLVYGTGENVPYVSLHGALEAIYSFSQDNRGKRLVDLYTGVMQRLTLNDARVVQMVIQKDIRAGVAAKTFNKAFPNDLIYIQPYMGARPDNKKNRAAIKIKEGAFVETKMDGMYVDAVVADGKPSFYTRQGVPLNFDGTALKNEYSKLSDGSYQGEALIYSDNTAPMNRDEGNGIIRMAQDGSIPVEFRESLVHVLWDYLPLIEWRYKESNRPRKHRISLLEDIVLGKCDHIGIVDYVYVTDWQQANEFYAAELARGGEGAIVKSASGVWKDGKPAWQVKMKVEEECDLVCTGVVPHKKKKGAIGALILESKCGELRTQAGGMSNRAMRVPPVAYVGKVVRVKYNALSKYNSLSHPRVAHKEQFVRGEGSEAHTLKEIKSMYNAALGIE